MSVAAIAGLIAGGGAGTDDGVALLAGALAAALTGDAFDPEAKIPEFKHSAVTVEPVADGVAEGSEAAGDE
jgi:hypothetical protein